jgi:hypothetical protein
MSSGSVREFVADKPVDMTNNKNGGRPMTCLICAGPAEELACSERWEERKCAACGHYRMSHALVLALMDQGQIFDVEKARAWLVNHRIETQIPSIEKVSGLLQT